mmetsp:Transcript_30757/g.105749  ORF Transcript_30757/g.105749 Transcript_30757/m.105749 type:complete len:207 (-) Transcript_30757:2309-2929(-)
MARRNTAEVRLLYRIGQRGPRAPARRRPRNARRRTKIDDHRPAPPPGNTGARKRGLQRQRHLGRRGRLVPRHRIVPGFRAALAEMRQLLVPLRRRPNRRLRTLATPLRHGPHPPQRHGARPPMQTRAHRAAARICEASAKKRRRTFFTGFAPRGHVMTAPRIRPFRRAARSTRESRKVYKKAFLESTAAVLLGHGPRAVFSSDHRR